MQRLMYDRDIRVDPKATLFWSEPATTLRVVRPRPTAPVPSTRRLLLKAVELTTWRARGCELRCHFSEAGGRISEVNPSTLDNLLDNLRREGVSLLVLDVLYLIHSDLRWILSLVAKYKI